MKTNVLVPFSACIPDVAYHRIRQEARLRRVHMAEVIIDLLLKPPPPRYSFSGLDPVDWENEEQVNGIVVGEFAMHYLPPSCRELQ